MSAPTNLKVSLQTTMNGRGMKDCPAVSGCTLLGLLLVLLVLTHSSQAVPDFTCFNPRLYATAGNSHTIGGYKSGSDTEADVSFERVLDTGSGRDLPTGGSESQHPVIDARLYRMPASIGADRFGAYNCIFRSQDPVKITTIILRENGDVSPASSTLTTSAGEDVTLTMTQHYGSTNELRWRHSGDDVTAWNGQSSISILNVQPHHAGIYECFRDGRHHLQNHALMKLLVRQCSPNKWGPSCDNDCPFCYNGGQCDDKTGDCICAPGFSGLHCDETLRGKNWFGQDSQLICSNSNPVRACQGNLMCLPDPFGCTCAASFTGQKCKDDCDDGYFGAGCKLKCNCAGNAVCDKGNGTCRSGVTCTTGYTGENCQICPDGRFGVNCVHRCHCENNAVCDKGYGTCPNNVMCANGFRGDNCQNSCPYGQIGLLPDCTACYVPVSVIYEVSSEQDPSRTITWTKAPQNKCPVIDYAIQYQLVKRDLCQEEAGEFETLHNTTERQSPFPHPDSLPNSIYKVRVLARNEAGLGEPQTEDYIELTTPEKEPTGSPTDFTSTSRKKYSVAFSWSEIPCGQRKGVITKYRLSYRVLEKPYDTNFSPNSSFQTVDIEPPDMHSNISGLEPTTKYDFRLKGFNSAGVGEDATLEAFTEVETDISAPTQLSEKDISDLTSSTVTIALSLPSSSKYITGIQVGVQRVKTVTRRDTSGSRYQRSTEPTLDYVAAELPKKDLPATLTVGDGETEGNKPLESNTQYDIYLGSVSRTSQSTFAVEWNEPLRVQVPQSASTPVAAIVVPLMLIVLIGIVVAVVFKIRRKKRLRHLNAVNAGVRVGHDKLSTGLENPDVDVTYDVIAETITNVPIIAPPALPATTPATAPANKPATSLATAPATAPARPKPVKKKKKQFTAPSPIPLSELKDYVSKKKKETYKEGNGFLFDYESLPDFDRHSCERAKDDKNKEKNRYVNVIPYDFSRVVLEKLPDQPDSDYVNASYIDGFNEPNKYIASQGPNKASVCDMWRMIWQENTTKIVMLTNLQEGVKEKCEKYWPDKTAQYGDYVVTLKKEETHADYIVRHFIMTLKLEDEWTKQVRQYHFTTWPDTALPDDPIKVVNFVKMVKSSYNQKNDGPMVVHCSTGIGRTGVFVVLDAMLDQAKAEDRVDIWNFACGMRDKRMKMIQSPAQYEFIFEVLIETFLCGDTSFKPKQITPKLTALKKVTKGSRKTGLQLEFETLNLVTNIPDPVKFKGGRQPENVEKNRFPDKLPADQFRPHLMTSGQHGSNNYINACFLNSPSSKGKYIATQMPLPHTISDMWRMVYDYKSTCIVMLNTVNKKDPTCVEYWPERDSASCGNLTVTLQSTDKVGPNIIIRYLALDDDQESRLICHLQLLNWPVGGVPSSPKSIVELVTAVKEWQLQHKDDRIIIQCIDGEGASGTFCALLNVIEKLNIDNVVDVFQEVKKLRVSCHRLVQSQEQYELIYEAIRMHLGAAVVYANI
ncbi:receptor-type tyrosine-protein phosphatase T-like isoform X2 [Asterias amurensis]|uniref:receptor-type tyrosine-protein phosphatase T-like isoform X2 n=1 Tax=Asterias amurensis TaxID=7602 RepID=UPI003AB8259A